VVGPAPGSSIHFFGARTIGRLVSRVRVDGFIEPRMSVRAPPCLYIRIVKPLTPLSATRDQIGIL